MGDRPDDVPLVERPVGRNSFIEVRMSATPVGNMLTESSLSGRRRARPARRRPADLLGRAVAQVNTLVLGKPQEVRLAFVALLSDGHLLIEDLPGLGKTTLAHALAATLGLGFQRVQFTSDLLPSDIVGVSVFDAQARRFEFHPGRSSRTSARRRDQPRATAHAERAARAMAEHQVTVDGDTHALPDPFFVIATQNPSTWPAPIRCPIRSSTVSFCA
jgi:MoxR-like ATPase